MGYYGYLNKRLTDVIEGYCETVGGNMSMTDNSCHLPSGARVELLTPVPDRFMGGFRIWDKHGGAEMRYEVDGSDTCEFNGLRIRCAESGKRNLIVDDFVAVVTSLKDIGHAYVPLIESRILLD